MKDLTKGSPLKRILMFCWPLLLANLLQQFYGLADSVIVGRFLGVNAFAGVGSTESMHWLIIGFATGICSGCAIPVAQSFGAGSEKDVRAYTGQVIYVGIGISLCVTLFTFFVTRPALRLLGTPEEIFDYAYRYIFIVFMGSGAIVLYNMAGSLLRALGDSRTPLVFLIITAVLNIGLDILFIAVFGMGVEGAAYATVISQLLSGVGCVVYIRKKVPILHVRREDFQWDPKRLKRVLDIGIPMGLQSSITAVGGITMTAAINSLGAKMVAAATAGKQVSFFLMAPFDSLGLAMATYCGQNLGAGKLDRVHKGVRCGTAIGLIYGVTALLLSHFCGRPIATLFMDTPDSEILQSVQLFSDLIGLFYPVLTFVMVYRNALQGLGYSNSAMFAGVAELAGRLTVAFGLVGVMGFHAVCLADPLAWSLASALLLPMYFIKIRKLDKETDCGA